MKQDNAKTLNSYQQKASDYIASTGIRMSREYAEWVDLALSKAPGKKILEVGSGNGVGAFYLREHGYNDLLVTDAVPAFIEYLTGQGFKVVKLDLLKDQVPGQFDLILALAVLLHFTPNELEGVLAKLHGGLNDGGVLAFCVKEGEGEEWSSHKLDAPRFFHYWVLSDLEKLVKNAGFEILDHSIFGVSAKGMPWLNVIARKA